ncbi:hypothetical protein [Alcanivorax sp. 1008]|uniref:hypothetical protein n=1 Tax=Alcanivorax sp. 1008 TaxID=2816853 RepID=UPI001D842DEE|nr:hypothetical protein [Alcanivorax sp. 1008]MCC1496831.1 hypothetical protein [Alcanivorax sp. 1008]
MKRAFLGIAVAVALQSGTSFAQEPPQFRNAMTQISEPRILSAEQVLIAGARSQQMLLESMTAVADLIDSPARLREFLEEVAAEGRAGLVDAAAQCADYYSTDEFQSLAQRCIEQEMIALTAIEDLSSSEYSQADVDQFRANLKDIAEQRIALNESFVAGISESIRTSSRAPLDQALRSSRNHAASLVRCAAFAIEPIMIARAEARAAMASNQP